MRLLSGKRTRDRESCPEVECMEEVLPEFCQQCSRAPWCARTGRTRKHKQSALAPLSGGFPPALEATIGCSRECASHRAYGLGCGPRNSGTGRRTSAGLTRAQPPSLSLRSPTSPERVRKYVSATQTEHLKSEAPNLVGRYLTQRGRRNTEALPFAREFKVAHSRNRAK